MTQGPAAGSGTGSALPPEWTTFVGRDVELAELERLLGASRLLTLTGAGGSGKTRLARELVARGGAASGPGFGWVELAGLEDALLVPRQVAAAFGIPEEVTSPAMLAELLRSRNALVVLDNCEHLVDACAEVAHALLQGCPELRILATSREALGVKGERAWLVAPLAVPSADATPEEIGASAAVQLFVDRASDASPTFALAPDTALAVAEICRRLDGIPLAVELAAARVKALSPAQIRDRLDDVFRILAGGGRTAIPRHRTLRATIDWSHDLLPEPSRVLFRRLSAFRGGFTLEAAESVCAGDGLASEMVLEEVARLVDRSMVGFREEGGGARYTMLEPIRQYAAARLRESDDEEEVRTRHAEYVAKLVATWEPSFTTRQRRAAFAALKPEMDNIREVLAWTRGNGPETHVRLVGGLWWFWFSTQHWTEASGWIREAIDMEAAQRPGRERAAVLFAAGALAALQAQADNARPLLVESAALAATAGDAKLEAYALNYLGMSFTQRADPAGREPSERAEAWFRAHGDDYGLRLALLLLGLGAHFDGRPADAIRMTEEAVAVARRFGEDRELAVALQNLGLLRIMQGDPDRAEHLLMESIAASRRDPSYFFVATTLDSLGELRIQRGRTVEAARLLGAAEALRESIGAKQFQITRARLEPHLARLLTGDGAAAFAAAWGEGRMLTLEVVLDEVLSGAHADRVEPTSATADRAVAPTRAAETSQVSSAASALEATPPDLSIRTLGELRIELAGRVLDAEAWSYAKPRELLVFFAVHPEGRTRQQIGRAIWPEATRAQVKNSFHVTLHHLRKTLGGPSWVVIDGDRYRLSPQVRCDLDATRFEREVRAALRDGITDVERLRATQALYAGDFLAGEMAGPWREEEADRLRRLWVDISLRLAEALAEQGAHEAAAQVYHEVAVREELNEEAHRGLMREWTRSGDRARAIRHYDRLIALLRDELDSLPEPETVALHDSIRLAQVS